MIISYARGLMDHAAFHKSQKTRELIESVGCKLIFLPPYSPDLNPIEKFWAHMKRWIKQEIVNFATLFESIASFFNTLSQINLLYRNKIKRYAVKFNIIAGIVNLKNGFP
jgi:transposase